jgi:hypothetical protein
VFPVTQDRRCSFGIPSLRQTTFSGKKKKKKTALLHDSGQKIFDHITVSVETVKVGTAIKNLNYARQVIIVKFTFFAWILVFISAGEQIGLSAQRVSPMVVT